MTGQQRYERYINPEKPWPYLTIVEGPNPPWKELKQEVRDYWNGISATIDQAKKDGFELLEWFPDENGTIRVRGINRQDIKSIEPLPQYEHINCDCVVEVGPLKLKPKGSILERIRSWFELQYELWLIRRMK